MTAPDRWKPPRQQCPAKNDAVRDFYRDSSAAPGGGPVRIVSLTLALYYNAARGCAWPSVRTLAASCHVGTETVTNAVKVLVAAGEWTVVTVPYGEQRRNVYVPTLTVGLFPTNGRAAGLAEKRELAAGAKAAKRLAASRGTGHGMLDPCPVGPDADSPVGPDADSPVGPDEACREAGKQDGISGGSATASVNAPVAGEVEVEDPFGPPSPAVLSASSEPVVVKAKTAKTKKPTPVKQARHPQFDAAKAIVDPWWEAGGAKGTAVSWSGVMGLVKTALNNETDPAAVTAALHVWRQSGAGLTAGSLGTALKRVEGESLASAARPGFLTPGPAAVITEPTEPDPYAYFESA